MNAFRIAITSSALGAGVVTLTMAALSHTTTQQVPVRYPSAGVQAGASAAGPVIVPVPQFDPKLVPSVADPSYDIGRTTRRVNAVNKDSFQTLPYSSESHVWAEGTNLGYGQAGADKLSVMPQADPESIAKGVMPSDRTTSIDSIRISSELAPVPASSGAVAQVGASVLGAGLAEGLPIPNENAPELQPTTATNGEVTRQSDVVTTTTQAGSTPVFPTTTATTNGGTNVEPINDTHLLPVRTTNDQVSVPEVQARLLPLVQGAAIQTSRGTASSVAPLTPQTALPIRQPSSPPVPLSACIAANGYTADEISAAARWGVGDYAMLASRCDIVRSIVLDDADPVLWLAQHNYDSPDAEWALDIHPNLLVGATSVDVSYHGQTYGYTIPPGQMNVQIWLPYWAGEEACVTVYRDTTVAGVFVYMTGVQP